MADHECCICGTKKAARSGSGYEPLKKCITENGAETLMQQAEKDDEYPSLRAEVAGVDWQTIIAREYYYHKSCYKKPAKKRVPKRTVVVDNADADNANFIAVIGKRFGDAGLRAIIVESCLLGESSVDQMFRGKHYNNAMRILKYLYDAMKKRMIESYEQSVQIGHLEISYKDFIESAGLSKTYFLSI